MGLCKYLNTSKTTGSFRLPAQPLRAMDQVPLQGEGSSRALSPSGWVPHFSHPHGLLLAEGNKTESRPSSFNDRSPGT